MDPPQSLSAQHAGLLRAPLSLLQIEELFSLEAALQAEMNKRVDRLLTNYTGGSAVREPVRAEQNLAAHHFHGVFRAAKRDALRSADIGSSGTQAFPWEQSGSSYSHTERWARGP
ncbi:hypothetical protein WJX73_004264 [Symbiochloris irregularis]|uniref:Uncharacterized protein n=1 Tax=Symbiochloris irregularis TaxID=706552 RepID=A0AAW1PDE4_9CHLO